MSEIHIHNITRTNDGHPVSIEMRNEDNDLQIYTKWDGCCDIYKYSNGLTPDEMITADHVNDIDYIHVCEMQEFIDELQQLVNLAKENLDKKDFENYWK